MKKTLLLSLMTLTCLCAGAQNVAKIGNTEYATINAAFEAAGNGATIQMIADANFQQSIKLNENEDESTHKTYTLDLNGKMLTFNPTGTKDSYLQRTAFILYGGTLNIVNSVPGVGGITNNTGTSSSTQVILVHGTYKKTCDPETEANINNLFTYLNVAEGVNFYTTGIGITVDGVSSPIKDDQGNVINKGTKLYWQGTRNSYTAAFGVRVDIRGSIDATKYSIKTNGLLGYPNADLYGEDFNTRTNVSMGSGVSTGALTIREYFYGVGTNETISASDVRYTPYVHIFPSAILRAGNSNKNTAAYCSGYARWLIEGTCSAANGVHVRSGEVVLNDAVVESTYLGTATVGSTGASGINGAGWAIVVESSNNLAGETSLTIQGDTKAVSEAEGGAALKGTIETYSSSSIESITIEGGTFLADNPIIISELDATDESPQISINGITIVGEELIGDNNGETAINSILNSEDYHATGIADNDGSTILIISDGSISTGVENIAEHEGESVNWKHYSTLDETSMTERLTSDLTLVELEINQSYDQTLTIAEGVTLAVERLILGSNAHIIVEDGGKLIVTGDRGIVSTTSDNIILKSSDDKQACFLINPDITSNRHPKAQIQLTSHGYQHAPGQFYWQRFGVPSWTSVPMSCMTLPARTQIQEIVNNHPSTNKVWQALTSRDDLLVPFNSYAMTSQSTESDLVYTFDCEMVGNSNAELPMYDNFNFFANSYIAPIDIEEFIYNIVSNYPHISATVYLYDPLTFAWMEINSFTHYFEPNISTTINPLQAFVIQRLDEGTNPVINYADAIWTPQMSNTPAPARANNNELTGTACISITAADGTKDEVYLVEDDRFSEAFDNSYDATKFMVDKPSFIYANSNNGKMGILATNQLNGTTIGITTTEPTTFTMTFSHLNGECYAIRDMLTGTQTEMAEGATYMFSVTANTTVDERFQVVKVNKVPTAIDHTESANTATGIYCVTGQYVGTDFHTLPAGMYIVNGKKTVK